MLDPKYLKDRSGQLPSYITLGTLAADAVVTLGRVNAAISTTPSATRTALGLGTAAIANTVDFATAAQGTLAGTALQPGFMPRTLCYRCIPGKESSGVAFRDISVKGNHATIEPGNTSGAFATENMMSTTAASAGGLFIYPAGVPIDFSVDSVLMSVAMKRATPAAAETVLSVGGGAVGVNAAGIYVSHRVGGFCRIVFNLGNGTLVSASDSLTAFSDATGSKEYHLTIAYDAPTRSCYIYRNGVLDNVNSGLLTGANALVSSAAIYGPRLGGIGASVHTGSTGTTVAGAFRGWQGYVAKNSGLPINISQIAALLAESPTVMLTDNEFRFVD